MWGLIPQATPLWRFDERQNRTYRKTTVPLPFLAFAPVSGMGAVASTGRAHDAQCDQTETSTHGIMPVSDLDQQRRPQWIEGRYIQLPSIIYRDELIVLVSWANSLTPPPLQSLWCQSALASLGRRTRCRSCWRLSVPFLVIQSGERKDGTKRLSSYSQCVACVEDTRWSPNAMSPLSWQRLDKCEEVRPFPSFSCSLQIGWSAVTTH